MKKNILLIALVSVFSSHSYAQNGLENLLLSASADSKKLLNAYLTPGMEGFINSMNSGWYHTAKVHKTLGFDISIGVNGAAVPSGKDFFTIADLGLEFVSSSQSTSPTITGPSNGANFKVNTQVEVGTDQNGQPIMQTVTSNFTAPGGLDLPGNFVPAPAVQLNVGLPFQLEAMVRFVPEITFGADEDNNSLNLFGFGLKKEITDWFGPMDKTPLHISLLAAYTNMTVSYEIEDITTGQILTQNAMAEFDLNAFTVQAIASLNLPIINIFGGIGYNSGNASFNMSGSYLGVFETGLAAPNNTVTQTLDVPTDLNFNSNGVTTTLGARLSLGPIKIYGSYAIQEFNTANLGIAFSIR